MNKVETALYRKKRSILEVCEEFGIPVDNVEIDEIEICSHCAIWYKHRELIPDLDNNPICKVCNQFYGL